MEELLEALQFRCFKLGSCLCLLFCRELLAGSCLTLQVLSDLLVDFLFRCWCDFSANVHLILYLIEIYLRILIPSVVRIELMYPFEELVAFVLLVYLQESLYIGNKNLLNVVNISTTYIE